MDPPIITSTANPRVRAALRLRERRERDRTGRTLVDGVRELRRAIDAGLVPDLVFTAEDIRASSEARSVVDHAVRVGATVQPVAPAVLERLAYGDRADGVVGIVPCPSADLDDLAARLPVGDPLIVVVEGVEKPGNVGAILRTADGAGADAVIVTDPGTDPYNPNVIRASLGAVFVVPLAVSDPRAAVGWLRERAVRIVTARVDALRLHTEADLTGPVAIVLGSEAEGLTPAWTGPAVESVRLPMHGRTDSLNVSVAAGVLLYEARRQRDAAGPP